MKYFIFFYFIQLNSIFSQNITYLSILPEWDEKSFVPDSTYEIQPNHFITIDVCKFYISDITFLKDSTVLCKEENSFHLLDTDEPETFHLSFNSKEIKDINKIRFNLGIDSLTNVAGAMGGDLDPTQGMYWTWQTGYINAKIEGKSSTSTARNNGFIFHLGGYKEPFVALKTIELPVKYDGNKISLIVDLSSFIMSIDLSTLNHIMSPSATAVKVSELLAKNFKSGSQ